MWTMYRFATNGPLDLVELREQFRRMTDEQLVAFGKAARYTRTPKANLGHPPRVPFVIQLREARGLASMKGRQRRGILGV